MNARVKVILTLAIVLCISLTPAGAWPAYIFYFTITLSVALYAQLGIGLLLKRSLPALVFILAAAPLIFSGPAPFDDLPLWGKTSLHISSAGTLRFISIAVKAWISVQAAILMAATTRVQALLAAFRQLRVPKLFVAIIGLMWRYLFVIIDEAQRLLRARASRSAAAPGIRSGGTLFWRAKVTGGMAGNLFLRSLERSERVYAAMLSRGYNGDLPDPARISYNRQDKLVLAAGLVLLACIWLLGLLSGA